jgi:gluconate 2-dehydrogenase gamma chain
MDRIIPADEDPGAVEAGAPEFLLRLLAGPDFVFARPDGSGFLHLTGKLADAWRVRLRTWRRLYREGLSELDRRARKISGKAFADLSSENQDSILNELSLEAVWSEFFELLLQHTREAYYGDPVYGGNLNRIGWQVIGFPGPSSLQEVHSGSYSTEAYFQPIDGRP